MTWAVSGIGAKSPSDVLDGLREAIKAGLSTDAALRGLTTNPAAMFGASAQIGTISVGKFTASDWTMSATASGSGSPTSS